MNAEAPRLVACRRNDATLRTMTDGDRTPAKLRVIPLLHRGIEGVHVNVDDLAHRHGQALAPPEQKENRVSPVASEGTNRRHPPR